jgi:hypothetical protein
VVAGGSTQYRPVFKQPRDLTPCSRTKPEGALEGLQESLVAYEEAAKRANNPDGA